jgi:hypothetical protein
MTAIRPRAHLESGESATDHALLNRGVQTWRPEEVDVKEAALGERPSFFGRPHRENRLATRCKARPTFPQRSNPGSSPAVPSLDIAQDGFQGVGRRCPKRFGSKVVVDSVVELRHTGFHLAGISSVACRNPGYTLGLKLLA